MVLLKSGSVILASPSGAPLTGFSLGAFSAYTNAARNLSDAWWATADPTSKLLPENLADSTYQGDPYIATRTPKWSIQNTAADLYSGLVWVEGYLNRGDVSDAGSNIRVALAYETANLPRVDSMPDDWNIDMKGVSIEHP